MNTLSWMIYAADALGNVKGLLMAIGIISLAVGLIAMMVLAIGGADGDVEPGSWKKPLRFSWIPIASGLFAAVLPSSTTVYMIAASEAGEAIVTSQDGKEMLSDVQSLIRKKLKEALAEPST